MKTIAIVQPSFLPWLGYFEQMSRSEHFVYLDDVQYTKNDWRNRNRIKTKQGILWLTIPVSFKLGENINEVHINDTGNWRKKHLQSIKTWYGKSEYYDMYFPGIEQIMSKRWEFLIDLNLELMNWLLDIMGLKTNIHLSSELSLQSQDKQTRLIEICRELDCDRFYEGKSGQIYIDPELFEVNGVKLIFQDYEHPFYSQLWTKLTGFISHLSVIDLLFNHGQASLDILSGRKIIEPPEGILIRNANDITIGG